ncbi:MAG: HD domain-containing protein [Candidatus Altiarchaeales archaeon]|nr:MAG: HD domain-containing protein [Candidatus Altiarchaeales archaeon]
MKHGKTIRDPIHGNITLSDIELRLLDTPQLQRMRRIKQNGLCYLIYPAMNSTRFEHSLGVMHLAGRVADHLELGREEKINLRIAGLLHDIGHCAFSHTSDAVLNKIGISHEENSIQMIIRTEIADILKENGINPIEVTELITGRGRFGKIISSEIDVDKMDYLIRDSYYAGVAYGIIDLERIIYGMKIIKGEMVINRGSLEAVESLLISRNMMYQTVYRHHTKRIVESMFSEALNDLLENGKTGYDEFLLMDDIDLVYVLRHSGGYSQDIMKRIDERRLFKIFFQENLSAVNENFRKEMYENKHKIQERIADDYGIERGYLLLDTPESKMSEFMIKVEDSDGELRRIDEISNLAKVLEKSEIEKLNFCIYAPLEEFKKLKNFNAERYIEFEQTRLKRYM